VNPTAALDIALQLIFLICLCFAIITDFKTLLIPNWISLALLAAFVPFAILHVPLEVVGGHLLAMGVVLALSVSFFVAGWMGGGDVKFMSAIALWMGPDHVAPFTVLMAFLGAAIAIGSVYSVPMEKMVGASAASEASAAKAAEAAEAEAGS